MSPTFSGPALAGTIFAGRLEWHDSLPSTIDACRARADEGAAEGTVILAAAQSAGRGQRGNSWISPPGGLYLSALLRPSLLPAQLPLMPLLVGVAACEALREDFGVPAWLKHPNDLLVVHAGAWRKIGGLLVDGAVQGDALRHAIVSLGVNCASPPGGFTGELASIAASLESLGAPASPSDLAEAFLRRLAAWRQAMEGRPQSWADALPDRHAALLRSVVPGQAAATDGAAPTSGPR